MQEATSVVMHLQEQQKTEVKQEKRLVSSLEAMHPVPEANIMKWRVMEFSFPVLLQVSGTGSRTCFRDSLQFTDSETKAGVR